MRDAAQEHMKARVGRVAFDRWQHGFIETRSDFMSASKSVVDCSTRYPMLTADNPPAGFHGAGSPRQRRDAGVMLRIESKGSRSAKHHRNPEGNGKI